MLELYQPFIIKKLLQLKLTYSIRAAKKLINEYNKIIIQILKITSKNIRIFKKIIR